MADREAKGRTGGTVKIMKLAKECCGPKRLIMARAKRGVHLWWEVRCSACNNLLGGAA